MGKATLLYFRHLELSNAKDLIKILSQLDTIIYERVKQSIPLNCSKGSELSFAYERGQCVHFAHFLFFAPFKVKLVP